MNIREIRFGQVFLLAVFSIYVSFVFLGNILDYQSNQEFVRHVLSMDTTFQDNRLMWRAIETVWLQDAFYLLIIITELIIAVIGGIGVYKMIRNFKGDSIKFSKSKKFGFYSFFLAILLWFVGFIVIGSEWFAMWQSEIWNERQTAMNIVTIIIGSLIFFSLPDFNRHSQ